MPDSPDQESAAGKEPTASRKRKRKPGIRPNPAAGPEAKDLESLLDPDSILGRVHFTTPKGNTYEMVITDQMDQYDKPESLPRPERRRKKRHK
jgi:hypothetical protein